MAEGSIDVPTILDAGFEDGPKGMKSLVVQQTTSNMRGAGYADPEIDAWDMRLARYVAEILVKHYHGYDWFVESDIRQGIVSFSIPDLVGQSLKCAINLRQHPDVPEEVIYRSAGLMLERMNLPRGPVTKAQVHEAKQRRHTFQFNDVGKKR